MTLLLLSLMLAIATYITRRLRADNIALATIVDQADNNCQHND